MHRYLYEGCGRSSSPWTRCRSAPRCSPKATRSGGWPSCSVRSPWMTGASASSRRSCSPCCGTRAPR
ncbi:hypothetical protein NKH77_53380 [Streptomyces sp. M19]